MSHSTHPAAEFTPSGFTPSGQLQLGVFFQGVNSGTVWKSAESGSQTDFESFRRIAQTAERGLFAAFFLGEGLRLREHLGRPHALDVVLDSRGEAAAERLAGLNRHNVWQSPRARFVGTAAELTELLTDVLAWADGVRLHPAVLETDLEELSRLVLPELRRRGLLARTTPDATFREQLGLARPASRYAAAANAPGTEN